MTWKATKNEVRLSFGSVPSSSAFTLLSGSWMQEPSSIYAPWTIHVFPRGCLFARWYFKDKDRLHLAPQVTSLLSGALKNNVKKGSEATWGPSHQPGSSLMLALWRTEERHLSPGRGFPFLPYTHPGFPVEVTLSFPNAFNESFLVLQSLIFIDIFTALNF